MYEGNIKREAGLKTVDILLMNRGTAIYAPFSRQRTGYGGMLF